MDLEQAKEEKALESSDGRQATVAASAGGVMNVFSEIKELFIDDLARREKIRLIVGDQEQLTREVLILLQGVHQTPADQTSDLCVEARTLFEGVRKNFGELKATVLPGSYYKFHEQWLFNTQRLCFLSSLVVYLEEERLATKEEVAAMLGVCASQEEGGFHLDLEDYLMGLLSLASELSRLAVNSVILGDYQRPFGIFSFVTSLSDGFRLLNLKNDALRRKFDALKYDLKRIEEVVYDVSIRGLKPTVTTTAAEDS